MSSEDVMCPDSLPIKTAADGVMDDPPCSGEVSRAGSVIQERQRTDLIIVQLFLLVSVANIPHSKGVCQHALDGEEKVTNSFFFSLFLLSTLRRWSQCWTFLTTTVVLSDQMRSSEM